VAIDYGTITPETIFTIQLGRNGETKQIDRQNVGDGLMATAMAVAADNEGWDIEDGWVKGSRDAEPEIQNTAVSPADPGASA